MVNLAGKYAVNTEVSIASSKTEIERILTRYGANRFMYGWDGDKAMIQFELAGRFIRFILPLPAKADFKYTQERRLERTAAAQEQAWEQGCRQRWRALALAIKAKLEAVECQIASFEEEFLAHIVLPDGHTVGSFMLPQVAQAYLTGKMPEMLPMLTDGGNGR